MPLQHLCLHVVCRPLVCLGCVVQAISPTLLDESSRVNSQGSLCSEEAQAAPLPRGQGSSSCFHSSGLQRGEGRAQLPCAEPAGLGFPPAGLRCSPFLGGFDIGGLRGQNCNFCVKAGKVTVAFRCHPGAGSLLYRVVKTSFMPVSELSPPPCLEYICCSWKGVICV